MLGRISAKPGVSEIVSAMVKLGYSTFPRKHLPSFKFGTFLPSLSCHKIVT